MEIFLVQRSCILGTSYQSESSEMSCCKCLVMLSRSPPAQLCRPVVKRTDEAVLKTQLSVPPLGMPWTAPASGLRGPSLPGLALLVAWGGKGTGRTRTGCRQELLWLKLRRPEKEAALRPQLWVPLCGCCCLHLAQVWLIEGFCRLLSYWIYVARGGAIEQLGGHPAASQGILPDEEHQGLRCVLLSGQGSGFFAIF
ncbi:uncharacterized protein WM294_015565 [Sarcoramphus papa]